MNAPSRQAGYAGLSVWFNHYRLIDPLGYISAAKAEANYYEQLSSQAIAPGLRLTGLHENQGDSPSSSSCCASCHRAIHTRKL